MGEGDILLINPPSRFNARERMPHTGLLILASILEKEGHTVRYLDFDYQGPTGIPKTDIVCLSATASQLFQVKEFIKRLDGSKIILGGNLTRWDKALKVLDRIDHFVIGEGETVIAKIIDDLKNGKKVKKIIRSHPPKNLDSLPFPAYHLVDLEKSKVPIFKKKCSYVFTSRGCPFDCTFCSIRFNPVRKRDVKNIVHEMRLLNERHSIKRFFFQCATFSFDKDQVTDLCKAIKEKLDKIKWGASTRCNLIDDEMLKEMKTAGCVNLNFGAESGSYKIRKSIGKDIKDKEIKESFELCKKNGILTSYFWLMGLPGETEEDIKKTRRLSLEVGDYAAYAHTNIYPGTKICKLTDDEMFERLAKKGSFPVYYPEGITYGFIDKMISSATLRFYLRPKQIRLLLKNLSRYNSKLYLMNLYEALSKRIKTAFYKKN